jgi:hypothetical protein
MGERARPGRRAGCIAIVVAAAVTLGLSIHHDLQLTAKATTPKSIANQEAQLRQEECLYKAIRLMVPEGATVYVTAPRLGGGRGGRRHLGTGAATKPTVARRRLDLRRRERSSDQDERRRGRRAASTRRAAARRARRSGFE